MTADTAALHALLLKEYEAVRRYGANHDSARVVAAIAISRRFDITRTRALAELDAALVLGNTDTDTTGKGTEHT